MLIVDAVAAFDMRTTLVRMSEIQSSPKLPDTHAHGVFVAAESHRSG